MNNDEKENEIIRLKAENQRLRLLLQKYGIYQPEDGKKLSDNEKINIYCDYFHGREDLYNKYYWNRKKRKFCWAVDCVNFWKENCPIRTKKKEKGGCFSCSARKFRPLTKQTLKHLFLGDMQNEFYGIGIYPLLKDNTCCFLAMDFDDDHWLENMRSVYSTAFSYGFYPVMERSQSGEGGHLWFFFAMPVKASDARRMGKILLERTMLKNQDISFDSFDRMFPSQDHIPANGAGNVIALPLRADTYAHGNSAFINAMGQVIKTPIEFLQSRPKIAQEELTAFLNEYELQDYFYDLDQLQMSLHTEKKFSEEIHGFIQGKIAIEKKGLNAATINVIRRCAGMWNPEYFERQRRHEAIDYRKTPSVLHFEEEDEKYIYIPQGLLEKLKSQFPETEFHLQECFTHGDEISVAFTGILRSQQEEAVNAMIHYRNGVLLAVPGFGKTICSIWMIAHFHVSTLILVNNIDLQNQWEKELNRFLAYPSFEKKSERMIRKYNGSSKKLSGRIDIATNGSLAKAENRKEILSHYGLVLVDECHSVPAVTFRTVLSDCCSEHLYGLTATPNRKDGLEKVIYMYCGPARYKVSDAVAKRSYQFQQVLIPRYTSSIMLEDTSDFNKIADYLIHDQSRNWLIYQDIMKEYNSSGKIIVLSDRISHLQALADMLQKSCDDVYFITGSVKKKERQNIIDKVRCLSSEKRYILLATSTLLGVGFDLPSLKTLFLTFPINNDLRIQQYTGRLHRNYEGKDVVKVYDYVDSSIPICMAMYRSRLKQYLKEGYLVEENKQSIHLNQFFFEKNDYLNVLKNDISVSAKEIIIFTSNPDLSFIQNYYKELQEPIHRGLTIIAILPESLKNTQSSEYMKCMGMHMIFGNYIRNFMIIDRKIVWMSNCDFLSDQEGRYCTREENEVLAGELLHSAHKQNNRISEGIFLLNHIEEEK